MGQDNPNKKKEPATPTYHMAQMTTKHKGEKYAEYLKRVDTAAAPRQQHHHAATPATALGQGAPPQSEQWP